MRVSVKERMTRIDHVVVKLNNWLFVIADGLAVLDFSVLVVKSVEALPLPDESSAAQPISPRAAG